MSHFILKLQEHHDNEKRIRRQINISKSLKANSDRALKVSFGALSLSFCFLIISGFVLINAFNTIEIGKDQLQISQKQLKLSEKRIELLESKGEENILSLPKKVLRNQINHTLRNFRSVR